MSNTNAALQHPVITIRVTEIFGHVVKYKLWHVGEKGKEFTFAGMIMADRDTIATMEPGRGYQVVQSVDSFNCTHWTAAHPYAGGKVIKQDAIIERVAAKKAERKYNEAWLDTVQF